MLSVEAYELTQPKDRAQGSSRLLAVGCMRSATRACACARLLALTRGECARSGHLLLAPPRSGLHALCHASLHVRQGPRADSR